MEFSVSRRGGTAVSLWFVLLLGLLCLPFWKAHFLQTLGVFLTGSAVFLVLFSLHFASCNVRVGAHHLTVRRGLLFTTTRRLPLRFITGCHILRTPLGRLCGVCALILCASGSTTILLGVNTADAERLAAFLAHERGNV